MKHNASAVTLTTGGTVLKESNDLVYWEWHLVQRKPSRRIFVRFLEQLLKDLISWGSPGEYSMIDRFLGDAFGVSSFLFSSIVLQCDAHLTLLGCVVSGARFLTGGIFQCDIVHRPSEAVLCILYKIRCNSMHPFYCALHVPCVPMRVTRGALAAHRYTYAPPRCRTSQYRRTF